MRLLIMGPPGAGKGTQAKAIADRYGIPAISTGDIFRANIAEGTALGVKVKQILDSGGYVGDDITNDIVADRLTGPDCAAGFLLDGYPRTVPQVEALDEMLARAAKTLNAVLSLKVDEDEVVDRLRRRAITAGRSDDTEDAIRIRQRKYSEETSPLLNVYATRGILVEVDGLGEVEDITKRIFEVLDARA